MSTQADLPETIALLKELNLSAMTQLLDLERPTKDVCKQNGQISQHSEQEQLIDRENINEVEQNDEEKQYSMEELSRVQSPEVFRTRLEMIDFYGSAQRNRELLFKRHRAHQQREIIAQLDAIEQQNQSEGNKSNSFRLERSQSKKMEKRHIIYRSNCDRPENIHFWPEDIEKLNPNGDLNDNIIEFYLQIFKHTALPLEITDTIHIFSTHFFSRLLGPGLPIELLEGPKKETQKIRKKVEENYKNIKRWSNKFDFFTKQIVVFPINAFNHWFSVIVRNPNYLLSPSKDTNAEIIYCDSMLEKRDLVIEAIKEYIRLQLLEKKKIMIPNIESIKVYQLLLPRQLNTHDCGLFMITYIDELLSNRDSLRNLHMLKNRNKLKLFPRKLIYTLRKRMLRLIQRLTNNEKKNSQILEQFWKQKRQILMNSSDYDTIDPNQYRKYKAMKLIYPKELDFMPEQLQQCQLIRFYLDAEVNHYQKDINIRIQ